MLCNRKIKEIEFYFRLIFIPIARPISFITVFLPRILVVNNLSEINEPLMVDFQISTILEGWKPLSSLYPS